MPKRVRNISEIRVSLKKIKLPTEYRLGPESIINNVPLFIESHLCILGTDPLKRIHRPYYYRLKEVLSSLDIEIDIEEYVPEKTMK